MSNWRNQLPKWHPMYQPQPEPFTYTQRLEAISVLEKVTTQMQGEPSVKAGQALLAIRLQRDAGEVERSLAEAIRRSPPGESRLSLERLWRILFHRNVPR